MADNIYYDKLIVDDYYDNMRLAKSIKRKESLWYYDGCPRVVSPTIICYVTHYGDFYVVNRKYFPSDERRQDIVIEMETLSGLKNFLLEQFDLSNLVLFVWSCENDEDAPILEGIEWGYE